MNQHTFKSPSSQFINDFIKSNYKKMDDVSIGVMFGLSKKAIYNRRVKMDLRFYAKHAHSKDLISNILHLFSNNHTIAAIARITRRKPHQINKVLYDNFFVKKKSEKTITLILESKINYEPNNYK